MRLLAAQPLHWSGPHPMPSLIINPAGLDEEIRWLQCISSGRIAAVGAEGCEGVRYLYTEALSSTMTSLPCFVALKYRLTAVFRLIPRQPCWVCFAKQEFDRTVCTQQSPHGKTGNGGRMSICTIISSHSPCRRDSRPYRDRPPGPDPPRSSAQTA